MSEETPKKKVARKAKAKKFNWRDHLDSQYVILKEELAEELEKKYKEPFSELKKLVKEGKDNIADFYKLILMEGYRDIARKRGYVSELLDPNCCTPDYCSFVSTVTWASNEYGEGVTTSDVGECFASQENLPFCYFPSSLAANRAFVRNIRKFLGIPILGKDELLTKKAAPSEQSEATVSKSPNACLKEKCEKHNLSFEKIKGTIIKKHEEALNQGQEVSGWEGVENWNDWEDIAPEQCLIIIGFLKRKEKESA